MDNIIVFYNMQQICSVVEYKKVRYILATTQQICCLQETILANTQQICSLQ